MTAPTITFIRFRIDKRGRKIAFRRGYDWRYFRCSLAWAENLIAQGLAVAESSS